MSSPDHTFPEALTTPDRTTTPKYPAAVLHRLHDKAAPTLRELWSTGNAIGRLSPKMRTAQIAASVVATGVLSAVLGGAPAAEHAPEFRAAPEAAGHVQPGPVSPPNTGPGLGGAPVDPVDGWIGQATAVLEAHGVPRDEINPEALRTIILHESGGDPMAANGWDSNASAGTPSKGLMQTIEPTFHSFAVPGHQDIWNPVDNIVAATRYSIDRYGSVSNVPGVVGVGSGGGYEGY
ncbi:transglycosylase SLT domain-containing protein [Saccharopolyspora gloriosae]|uniref:transglycosylase SLT domain-containing protein n=1 Tax=Saccharopolyspora gloriosae TaxID=455344 RepID=UPI001FB7BD34|nr:transglycosylase SLT domain-containing protein [Saccharopolyspora gloriosae]